MIQIKDVSKTYETSGGTFEALKHINLTIEEGDIFGIVGMSGAGKSTLIRCMNLLENPTSGQILVKGLVSGIDGYADLCSLNQKQLRQARRGISMIFQQFNLLMQRSCLKNICFPMEISGIPKDAAEKKAKELLEIVGLPDRANSYPSQLSGGQKQRIAIARALACEPKILLCDEATSALDPTTTRSILRLLQDINKKLGITVVIITHEMAVVEEICGKVAVLECGQIVESGSVEEVFSNPKSDAARHLVYPDGVILDPVKTSTVVRLAFHGGSSYEPLISSLSIDCGIKVTILGADTRNIDGQAFGTMLIGLPDDPESAAKARAYLNSQPNISMEEVHDYHV